MTPRFHATPPEAVNETVREVVFIDDYAFHIERPTDSDKLFDHPWVRSAYAADEYTPYWASLWPSARMLAKVVVREQWNAYPQPVRVLEVGCGLGLTGIACLACGLSVTFSDVDETALTFATANARLNGFTDFRTQLLDFRYPPGAKYAVVIGSDLIYQDQLVVPLTRLLAAVLAPGGVCLVTDPDRPTCRRFVWHLAEVKLKVETDTLRLDDAAGGIAGTLYRIRNTT